MEVILNFDSPTYLAKLATGKTPESIFQPVLNKLHVARRESEVQHDRYIREAQVKLRFVQQGGDLSTLA